MEKSFTGLWEKEKYTAYTAVSASDSKYYAVGVVKDRALEATAKKLEREEKEQKLKRASEKF